MCVCRCESAGVLGAGCVQLHDSPAERGSWRAVRRRARGRLRAQHEQCFNQEQPGEIYCRRLIPNTPEMCLKDSHSDVFP